MQPVFPVSSELTYSAVNEGALVDSASPVEESVRVTPGLRRYTPSWRRLARIFRGSAQSSRTNGHATDGSAAKAVLDSLNDWICGVDATGRVTFANATLARDHNAAQLRAGRQNAQQALTGRWFVDLMPPAANEMLRLAMHRAIATGEPQTCQHEIPVTGGGESWRQWTFQALSANAPRELVDTSLLVVGHDITERKRLEHQFLHAQRVGSIGLLASGIAHDLNNVLAPITMSADLLKLRGCSEENRSLLDLVATSAARGAGLVSQMLTFTRGLEGSLEIVDLGSLVKELGRFIARTFAKNIQVRMEIAPDLWRLHANPTHIFQVLLNLCVNARDAMPGGGVLTIAVENLTLDEPAARALPEGVPGQYVVLSVSDTGTGIPPEIVGRIFDPFFTTKPVGKGTGLGLSTVQSIMKACGGFISLNTQVGTGTTFRAFFPVAAAAAVAPVEPAGFANARGAGEHVLVVDDEAFFRDVTFRVLEDFGYAVHVAADGMEAVRILNQHRGQIVVAMVDLDMPVMDGRTAIKAMKAISPDLHIITISGSGAPTTPPWGEHTELELTKPYSMGTLLHGLRDVLTRAPAGGEKGRTPSESAAASREVPR